MISILCLALMSDCNVCNRVVKVQAVQHVAASYVQTYPVVYPSLVYSMGSDQRLQKLESIAEQNVLLLQQQQLLIQTLKSNGQLNGGVAISPNLAAANRIVQASCIKCHTGAAPKGNLDMTDLTKLNMGQKMLMVDMVENAEMPPKPGSPVSDDDFQALRKWALEDRQAVREFLKASK